MKQTKTSAYEMQREEKSKLLQWLQDVVQPSCFICVVLCYVVQPCRDASGTWWQPRHAFSGSCAAGGRNGRIDMQELRSVLEGACYQSEGIPVEVRLRPQLLCAAA